MADHPTEAALTPRRDATSTARPTGRQCAALLAGVALLVLTGAFAWLALDHGTLRLWSVIVHESGRYTLGETILYFSHFLREIPIAAAYALFLLAVSGGVTAQRRATVRTPRAALTTAAVIVAGSFLIAASTQGVGSALQDLLQYRTRDDLAGYGTHWRYHWLSTLWFGAATALVPFITTRLAFLPPLCTNIRWSRFAWTYFIALSILFGPSVDIFTDPRYAGHQAREVMTHASVTLLLGLALILTFSRPSRALPARATWRTWLLGGIVLLVPVWLAAVSLTGDVMVHGQSAHGLGAMVAAHYFEHALDYLLVMLLLFGGLAARSRWIQPEPGDVANSAAA